MAVYLLLGSFFPKGDYAQLLRLTDLAQHFRLHLQEARAAGQDVSFQRFLQMHYLNTQMHQGDHEQDHEDLPFQHITPTIDQVLPIVWEMIRLTAPSPLKTVPDSTCSLFPGGLADRIFHPPMA